MLESVDSYKPIGKKIIRQMKWTTELYVCSAAGEYIMEQSQSC